MIGHEAHGDDANEHSNRILGQIAKGEGAQHDAGDGPRHDDPEIGEVPAPPPLTHRKGVHEHEDRQHDRRRLHGPDGQGHEGDPEDANAAPEAALGDTHDKERRDGQRVEEGVRNHGRSVSKGASYASQTVLHSKAEPLSRTGGCAIARPWGERPH